MTISADPKRARWAAVPAQRSNAPTLRLKLWLVLGTLLFSAAMGVLSVVVVVLSGGDAPDVQAGPSPYSVAVAEAVAADFLAGRTTAQPVAEGVTPSFLPPDLVAPGDAAPAALAVTRLSHAGTQTSQSGDQTITTHVFLVSASNGRYLLRVPLLETAVGPVLGALPLLSPMPTYPAPAGIGRPAGTEEVPVTPLVAQRISEWAAAYAANDGNTLAALVGNDDPNATFAGLGGFTARAQPLWAYRRDTNAIVVRTQLLLSGAGANLFTTAMDVDLLVLNPDTSRSPSVAAWGPAGSGPTLQPSANNLTR
jgi:hypothetical protein